MPPSRTRRPSRVASEAICFSTRSVVRMAPAAAAPPSASRLPRRVQASQQHLHRNRHTDRTCGADQHLISVHTQTIRQGLRCLLTVNQAAITRAGIGLSELISTARACPLETNRSAQRSAQAAHHRGGEGAGTDGTSGASTSARSGPDSLSPAVMPAARKPRSGDPSFHHSPLRGSLLLSATTDPRETLLSSCRRAMPANAASASPVASPPEKAVWALAGPATSAVLDADQYAHDALTPGEPAWQAVIDRYGNAVCSKDLTRLAALNRSALGSIVLRMLRSGSGWALIHPVVRDR